MNNDFLNINNGYGYLTVKATKASEAIPVSGMKIEVNTIYNNKKMTLFSGVTDSSGIIEKIKLPAPKNSSNNLEIPKMQTYQIYASYKEDNFEYIYNINIYDGLIVVQNINVLPNTRVVGGVWQ